VTVADGVLLFRALTRDESRARTVNANEEAAIFDAVGPQSTKIDRKNSTKINRIETVVLGN